MVRFAKDMNFRVESCKARHAYTKGTNNGVQYSVDRKYIDEYVSVEPFGDMLQIYYKGKLIQVHTISRNPIN